MIHFRILYRLTPSYLLLLAATPVFPAMWTGRLLDAAGQPLSAITVDLAQTGISASTDSGGRFTLDGILGIRAVRTHAPYRVANRRGERVDALGRARPFGNPSLLLFKEAPAFGTRQSPAAKSSAGSTLLASVTLDTLRFRVGDYLVDTKGLAVAEGDLGDITLPFTREAGEDDFVAGLSIYAYGLPGGAALTGTSETMVQAAARLDAYLAAHAAGANAPMALVLRGRIEYDQSRYDSSETWFSKVLSDFPASAAIPSAWYYRGKARYYRAAYAEARADFAALLAGFPGNALNDGAAYLTAKSYYQQNAFDSAYVRLEAFRAAFPASHFQDEDLLYLGKCRYNQAMYPEAIALLAGMFQQYPASTGLSTARYYIGKSRMQMGAADSTQYEAAIGEFRAVISGWPQSQDAIWSQRRIGEAYYYLGSYAEARAELAKTLAQTADTTEYGNAKYFLARCDVQEAKYAAAVAGFQDVVDHHPESSYGDDAHYQIGKTLYLMGKYPESAASLRQTRQLFPGSVVQDNVSFMLVKALGASGDCVQAAAEMDAMRKDFPASPLLPLAESSLATRCP